MKVSIVAKILVQSVLYAFRVGKRTCWPNAKPHFDFTIEVKIKKEQPSMIKVRITDEQKVRLSINPTSAKGKPVKVEKPAWTVVDGGAGLSVADDGLSAEVTSPDSPGVTNIQIQADADLGDGVDTITELVEVTVIDPEASSLGVQADTPVDKAA